MVENKEGGYVRPFDINTSGIPGTLKEWRNIRDKEQYTLAELEAEGTSSLRYFMFATKAYSMSGRTFERGAIVYLTTAIFTTKLIGRLGLELDEIEETDIEKVVHVIDRLDDSDWDNPILREAFNIAGMQKPANFYDAVVDILPKLSPNINAAMLEIEKRLGSDRIHTSSFLEGYVDAWFLLLLKYLQRYSGDPHSK